YHAEATDGQTFDPPQNTVLLFQNLAFAYAEGYLGKERYVGGRDTIEIDFFDNWIQGDVWFEDPVITFQFENSFGLPTRSEINVFQILTVEEDVLPLESDFVIDGIDFPYPTLEEMGQVKTSSFIFNKDNSNIREVLGAGPIAVDYDINALTNPDEDPTIRGFITDSSYYRVQVFVDLPLHGSAIDFTVLDTFDLNLDEFTGVDYAEFKLVADNGMPVAIGVQGYFLDEYGQVLDSLLTTEERIIRGAPVSVDGLPTATEKAVTYRDFSGEAFTRIMPAKKLALTATFYTTTDGQQSVKILADQEVRVRLGAILGVSDDN
ncbi:MAG: hypothetical protein KDC54_18975, partial [Lewinella sp.]|nr:hypothetical protein [Lewinella sp.]